MGGYLFHQQQDEQYGRLMNHGLGDGVAGCIGVSDYFPVFTEEELNGRDYWEVSNEWIRANFYQKNWIDAKFLRDECHFQNKKCPKFREWWQKYHPECYELAKNGISDARVEKEGNFFAVYSKFNPQFEKWVKNTRIYEQPARLFRTMEDVEEYIWWIRYQEANLRKILNKKENTMKTETIKIKSETGDIAEITDAIACYLKDNSIQHTEVNLSSNQQYWEVYNCEELVMSIKVIVEPINQDMEF